MQLSLTLEAQFRVHITERMFNNKNFQQCYSHKFFLLLLFLLEKKIFKVGEDKKNHIRGLLYQTLNNNQGTTCTTWLLVHVL